MRCMILSINDISQSQIVFLDEDNLLVMFTVAFGNIDIIPAQVLIRHIFCSMLAQYEEIYTIGAQLFPHIYSDRLIEANAALLESQLRLLRKMESFYMLYRPSYTRLPPIEG